MAVYFLRIFALSLIACAVLVLPPGPPAMAKSAELMKSFKKYQSLKKAGKYREAIPHAKRVLELGEKEFGKEHKNVGAFYSNLAVLYGKKGRSSKAEVYFQRALEIYEKKLGHDHIDIALTLNDFAAYYHAQERYKEAEPLYQRSLKIRESKLGSDHLAVVHSLSNLAVLYLQQGRTKVAEPLLHRSLEIRESKLGPDHLSVALSLNNLAGLYDMQGRYDKAESLYLRSLKIKEKKLDPGHPDVGESLLNLAGIYKRQRRYLEAEPYYRRSLKIFNDRLGPDHPEVVSSLNGLAELYFSQGHYNKAEPLYKRSLKIREKILGADHPEVSTNLNNLAALYRTQGRYDEAEPLFKRALKLEESPQALVNLASLHILQENYNKAEPLFKRAVNIVEKTLGPNHPFMAIVLNNQAELYKAQERYSEAEALYRRSIAVDEKAGGHNNPDLAATLNNLATLYQLQGHHNEAVSFYRRSLAIDEKARGPNHPSVVSTLNNLASLYFEQRDWQQAVTNWKRSADILTRRAERSHQIGRKLTGTKKSEVEKNRAHFQGLIQSVYRVDRERAHVDETFKRAQWAMGSKAAGALAQMSVRMGAGSSELANMVRERQDKVSEWQTKEKRMNALRGAGKSDKTLEEQMAQLDWRIGEIDKRLVKEFPEYAALASPKPLSITQAQKLLKSNEALILLLDIPEYQPTLAETFIWVVTKGKAVWKRAELGGEVLEDKVATLRCGIDDDAWRKEGGKERCRELTDGEYREHKLPFNLATAHELYSTLFGQIERELKGIKHLMVVSSGTLASLPLHLLVTEKPEHALPINHGLDYEGVPWLAQKYAITTLPSVSSLHALRGIKKKRGRAKKPLIGFGNPVLKGNKTCLVSNATKGGRLTRRSGVQRGVSAFFRGRLANVDEVRKLCPLPGSAKELNAVATDLDAVKEIRLGDKATETAVKKLSKDGKLDDFRIVYFSTHGLLSGGLKGLAEPALVFTPPQKASEGDDGLLTASEVALLKLNADWVVMSACNTAGGDKPGGEALSGLARAFFYSGAKALLVSHWPVYSTAATDLATDTFRRMRGNSEMGRATALQQSMLAFMNDQKYPFNSHPAFWAPFVVVGEGGADTQEAR